MMKQQKGFTLIELLVVIAIIGILSAIGLVTLSGAQDRAKDAKRKSDVTSLQSLFALYYDDYGGYPLESDTITQSGGKAETSAGAGLGLDRITSIQSYNASLPMPALAGSVSETYYYDAGGVQDGQAYLLAAQLKNRYYYYINYKGEASTSTTLDVVPVCGNTATTCP